jgi:hypothetical protein
VNEQGSHRFLKERFNLKKLKEVEIIGGKARGKETTRKTKT